MSAADASVTIALADANYLLGLVEAIDDRDVEEQQAVAALRAAIDEVTT